MKLSLSEQELFNYIEKLLRNYFPDNKILKFEIEIYKAALERTEWCIKNINKKYYFENGKACFNHLNSDQFSCLIYFLSHEAYLRSQTELAEKLFYLNKLMHGLDIFYSVKLPEIFLFVHPVGSVIGNASYSNYTAFYQNVTIGSDLDGIYPTFNGSTIFFSGSSVIGACEFGNNIILGARSFVLKKNIKDNCIVTGQHNINLKISKNNKSIAKDFFGINN